MKKGLPEFFVLPDHSESLSRSHEYLRFALIFIKRLYPAKPSGQPESIKINPEPPSTIEGIMKENPKKGDENVSENLGSSGWFRPG
jgi:hypothetical protein